MLRLPCAIDDLNDLFNIVNCLRILGFITFVMITGVYLSGIVG